MHTLLFVVPKHEQHAPTRSFSACSFSSCLVRMCFTTNLRATNSLLDRCEPHLQGDTKEEGAGRVAGWVRRGLDTLQHQAGV